MIAMLASSTSVNAAVSYYNSYIYVAASPKTVGIGQDMLLVAWTADLPPDIGETAGTVASPSGRAGWTGMQINLTKPDGTSTILEMPHSDPVGANYISYTPETAGVYTIQAIFPETWKNTTTNQAYYKAAVSYTDTFTVQTEPIAAWPEAPLPTGYWARPINGASRSWYVLAGDWLMGATGGGGASINTPFLRPQGTFGGVPQQMVSCYGPASAHILWTKPYYMGGIMDANYKDLGYQTAHYQGLGWTGNIILQGKLYYAPRTTDHAATGYVVVDLYTGETLADESNSTKPTFGQVYDYESPNQHGGFAYLWRTSGQTIANPGGVNGTVWTAIDPMTGQTVYQIANVSTSGTQVYGKDGSICYYSLNNKGTSTDPHYYLYVWNSSAIPSELAGTSGTNYWMWRPASGGSGKNLGGIYVHDGTFGYSVNASIPSPFNTRNSLLNETGTIRAIRESDYMIIGTSGRNDERGNVPGLLITISLKPETLGNETARITFDEPFAQTSANASNTLIEVFPDQNAFVCGNVIMQGGSKTLIYYGFDLTTGKQIWQVGPLPQFEYYNSRLDSYNGMLFLDEGYGGVLMAYNLTTGESIWNYTAKGVGFESPYGNYPTGIAAIADGNGLIYTAGSEHSPTQPLWRGSNLRCVNATDGTEVWKILFWGGNMGPTDPTNIALADGILLGLNYFDNEIYAFGKGPSATTVAGPLSGAVVNSALTLTGSVTDQTETGRRTTNDNFQFSLKGTPAISDADMQRWMEYLFMQQGYPADAKGVPVHLATIDPNGNYFDIGDVTSDINGNYGTPFTPNVPGTYQILATFAGSNAYAPSTASTYIAVNDVATVTQAPTTPEPTSLADTYFIPAIAGLFAFVAIMAVVTILVLRKRA